MRGRSLLLTTLVAGLLAMAPAAYAKGPLGATIEGEGVKGALHIDKPGELGQGTPMSELVEAIGFFELTFGGDVDVAQEAPTKTLGKSGLLVITWDMGDGHSIVQQVYLHAEGGPVTFVKPGQLFWEDTAETVGGWYTVTGDIVTPLTELGVDASAFTHLTALEAAKAAAEAATEPAPAPVKEEATKSPVVETPAAQAPARTPAAPASGMGGPAVALIVAAAALAAAIMGTTAWMRRRRPMPR